MATVRTPPTDLYRYVTADGRPTKDFYNWIKLISAGPLVTTVAGLPTGNPGDRAFVTDATVTTFASIVAGTGANFVPVFKDNAGNWRIG